MIVGPHCLNWFAPTTWGNTDNITLEISRVVLIVQIFAVSVELPKKYMLKHLSSIVRLLLPVMTFGWLTSSVFIWKLVPSLRWVEALVLAACITATDPVLASTIVGKGNFARRIPGHLRNLISAESGCNDGMAFPFVYLALLCIQYAGNAGKITFNFIVISCVYECVLGSLLGAFIGYCGRHAIKFAEKRKLIDRESFLVFYFVLALLCTGFGSIIGVDDLLVAFAAGAAFSWDGYFARKTEESHVSNVIDLLLNMSYFVYFGAIVPWDQFNKASLGLSPWKLTIIAVLILLFRRIPIVLALKPVIPDIHTWREALFCGHFGPIGVGGIFMSLIARGELEHGDPTPLRELPKEGHPNYAVVACIWPVTTFLVVTSILVHGSSVAVFALGKHLNNIAITVTYPSNDNPSQSWLSRIPRLSATDVSQIEPTEDDNSEGLTLETHSRPVRSSVGMNRRDKKSHCKNLSKDILIDLNVARLNQVDQEQANSEDNKLRIGSSSFSNSCPTDPITHEDEVNRINIQAYSEGSNVIFEDNNGEVIDSVKYQSEDTPEMAAKFELQREVKQGPQKKLLEPITSRGDHHVVAYRMDNIIIIENLDGEVIKKYHIASGGNEIEMNSEAVPHQASFSIMDKVLMLIGVKRRGSNIESNRDLEMQY